MYLLQNDVFQINCVLLSTNVQNSANALELVETCCNCICMLLFRVSLNQSALHSVCPDKALITIDCAVQHRETHDMTTSNTDVRNTLEFLFLGGNILLKAPFKFRSRVLLTQMLRG